MIEKNSTTLPNQDTKTLAILIVSYNTAELTVQTLDSLTYDLLESNLLKQSEIVVIDNNSKDASLEKIKSWQNNLQKSLKQQLNLKIIQNEKNVGFAHANNIGIKDTSSELVLLLNSDTIVQPGSIKHMVTVFMNLPTNESTAYLSSYSGSIDRLGILSAQLLYQNGNVQPQGGDLPNLLSLSAHLLFLDDIPLIGKLLPSTQHTGNNSDKSPSKSISPMGWVAGTALMIRRTTINEIGLLDENIFMYGEDIEWCIRAHNHHWDVAIDHSAPIIHIGSASSNSNKAILGELKGYRYIWAKHKPLWQRPLLNAIIKLACVLRIVLFDTILTQSEKSQPYKEMLQTFK